MSLVPLLAHLFAPWQSLFGDSKVVATGVTGVHLVALLFGGGLAIAADRATLRAGVAPEDRRRMLAELHAEHRPVLAALTFLFASGTALAAADVKTFATSPLFALKLVLVTLLLGNGLVLARTEQALRRGAGETGPDPRLWRRLRATAWVSLTLWTITALTGTALVNAA